MFSVPRLWAIVVKEFIQMRRDRVTFGMMIGVPLIQLVLFGYAINADPKRLPTAVLMADYGPQGRTVLHAIRNSGYFEFTRELTSEQEGRDVLARGDVQFVVNIPQGFTRELLRGERPAILIEADATDPAATSNAIGSLRMVLTRALQHDLKGPLAFLAGREDPIELRVHAQYNPEAITQYNIVPGLMGVVITMTMVMITGLAITRERERGTMENLLSMPTRPFEVMVGQIITCWQRASYSTCRCMAILAFCCWSPSCSSRRISPWALRFPRWPKTSFRPYSYHFSSSCRPCSCQASCSPSGACPNGRRPSVSCCR
jgi:ABC-2 type transport system permease protein